MGRMSKQVNLNADIAEGWGAYDIGNDAELMKIIKSASVACGFHAGDPNTMHRLCMLAKQEGVSVGVHPGFNDLWGFGRRRIQMKPVELEYMVAYQIGALQAMASYAGLKVTHLKPHGALNNMAAEDEAYAMAIGRAIKTVDRGIIYVAPFGSQMEKAAETLGLPLAREGFADRQYNDDGTLASRALPGTVLKDPAAAAEQVLRMVLEGEIVSRSGKPIKADIHTICVHGDEATGVAVARGARDALEKAGVAVVPLPDMTL
jgi:5-oxoprolinase (ATP-hydrolysing) subunit A